MTSNDSTSYVYDAENRLVWTSGYRYIYDGHGERVEKCQAANATTACPTSGTTGTLYWRGTGSDTLAETNLGGNDQEEYLFFNGQRIARRDTTSTGTTIAIHYYFSDHLGTHGVVENATGTTCEQDIDYYPYGGVEHDYCPNASQNYKFTGKERDSESGLDNFGARYHASSLGRFMTPDWAAKPATVPYAKFGDPQSLNLYSFVENGPVNRIDPDGHNWGLPGQPGGYTVNGVEGASVGFSALGGGNDWNSFFFFAAQESAFAAQNHNPPPPDANHTHTLTIRYVAGQRGNPFGHVTVQVDNGEEVGFGPVQDLTKKQIAENTPVPGEMEPRAAGVRTLDTVTIYLTKDEASHAQGIIDARTSSPGNYQLRGRSCVDLAEDAVRITGAPAPHDLRPSSLILDIRAQQLHDNSVQAP